MQGYSRKVHEHFKNPRNVGNIEDANGVGEIGDAACGDFLRVFIRVEDDIVVDVKYQIRGCPAAIACASVMTDLVIGKNLDDAMMISDEDIVEALEGLPEEKLHCSNLGAQGLQQAIYNHFVQYIERKTS